MKNKLFLTAACMFIISGCKIKTVEIPELIVTPASIVLVYGGVPSSQQITVKVIAEDETNVKILWSSDNDDIATVSQTGLVTATGVGDTNINVEAGNASRVIPVSVLDKKSPYDGFVTGEFLRPGEEVYLPAGYTGIEEHVDLNDHRYGAPQFIGKLFTEGLGRAPHPDEYKIYTTYIWENGCTQASLAHLAGKMFSSADFLGLGLSNEQTVFCIFRAVLNRDPTNLEIIPYVKNLQLGITPAVIAADFTTFEEFNMMIPDIIRGPYYWNGNNTEYSFSGNIMTSDELQQLLNSNLSVIELEPGTLVRLTSRVTIPVGKTLRTRGNPGHYIRQARIIQVSRVSDYMIYLSDGSKLENIWVDGNRIALDPDLKNDDTKIPWSNYGHNVAMDGNNTQLTGCRINDSTAGTCVFALDKKSGLLIANNLVTCYASNHNNLRVTDGITHAARNSIIENNHVVDATDVAIIPFRYLSTNPANLHNPDEPQDSKVRNNRVINLGNSAFAGLDIEPWYNQGTTIYFTGCEFINNEMWTSMKAHMHIAIGVAPTAWTSHTCDPAVGTDVINNYTPPGLFIQCSAGIAVDNVSDVVIKGNQLRLFIGDWARKCCRPWLDPRIYSINLRNSPNYDVQPGFINQTMWMTGLGFIDGALEEPFNSWISREAVIFDAKVTFTQ